MTKLMVLLIGGYIMGSSSSSVGDYVLGGATVASNVLNAGSSFYSAYKNYKAQKENLEYQKDLQQQIFNREDTATQRRVADLKAAGLSPVLAAGSAAGAGAPIQTIAPRMDAPQIPDIAGSVMALLRGKADIASTETQAELNKQKVEESKANTLDAVSHAAYNASNKALADTENAIKSYDLQMVKDAGVMYNSPSMVRNIIDAAGAIGKIIDRGSQYKSKQRAEELKSDMRKNPDVYRVKTPRG